MTEPTLRAKLEQQVEELVTLIQPIIHNPHLLKARLRAALDAAAREALEKAAEDLKGWESPALFKTSTVSSWLQARADALSGRHEEEKAK